MEGEKASYKLEYCIGGYHVYKEIWKSNPDDILTCRREHGNIHDLYAVCMVHATGIVVGHVPRKISTVCSMFLLKGGSISCQVTGKRRYSADLPQGGLELPCELRFNGPSTLVNKVQKILEKLPSVNDAEQKLTKDNEPPQKKAKVSHEATHIIQCDVESLQSDTWMTYESNSLSLADKAIIVNGEKLNDRHMTFCQAVLKAQFAVKGLTCTLFQEKEKEMKIKKGLQVIHMKSCDHWVLASSMSSSDSCLPIYDSIFVSANNELLGVLKKQFEFKDLKFFKFQKQVGGSDCGLFAIAAACALLFEQNPSKDIFNQDLMRHHLLNCIENCLFTPFPLMK